MAEYNEVYQRARYYDIAFARDVSSEVTFLADYFLKHAGRPLDSMLDVACGPGYHARVFAAQGVESFGLDLRPEMVEFARDQAQAEGLSVHWFAADMREFSLPHPVDMILTSYDSIDCLAEPDEIISHFQTVARNLTPQGLYVFELTHPRDCSMAEYGNFHYHGQRDGIKVDILWALGTPTIDPLRQVIDCDVLMRVEDQGVVREYHDRARERFCSPQEYIALARLSGALKFKAFIGDFRFDQPFDNTPGARRMIGIMERID